MLSKLDYLLRIIYTLALCRVLLRFGHVSIKIQGPVSISHKNVLFQDLAKSRSREIVIKNGPIALQFDRHLDSSAAEVPVKFLSHAII